MIKIKPMDESYLHLSCLHNGPINTTVFESPVDPLPGGHPPRPWSDETLREVTGKYNSNRISHPRPAEFMREMIRRYGTCAILAWEEQKVVGHLRFFPMKVARMLWQPDPSPILDCTMACDPEDDEGTLWVQCVMTTRPYVASSSSPASTTVPVGPHGPVVVTTSSGKRHFRTSEEAGARKGTGLKLVYGLIAWARQHKWRRIVKVAHCDLDWFYGIQGGGGKAFWERAGFKVTSTFCRRAFDLGQDFTDIVGPQMLKKGMSEKDVWTWYRMAYEL